ncbi:restriction endonuclease subunit S [Streptomyces sp. NPDC016172]|uniref:restriction endonuclease subunit S n=1 Tax=Streptomyces sp. NPDC016172 TaxID=3364964 RepID=UPI003703382A
MTRLGAAVQKIDERIPGVDLPLMSVSQTKGVVRRSELTDAPQRAESLDAYKVCRKGDIVFNKMKIRSGALGVAHEDGLVTYHYEVMRPREAMDPRYIVHLMKSSWFTSELIARERGISAGGEHGGIRTTEVPFTVLRTIDVLLPEIDEQRAIADYLDRETACIDTLIAEQQRLIELQRERRAAVVDAALAPSSSWTCTALKYVLDGIDQGVSPQAETGLANGPGAWGVLKSGCVNRGVFRSEEHKRLPDGFPVDPAIAVEVGDVIVSRASGSPDLVGSAAIVEYLDYRLILSDKLFRLRPQCSMDSRFLAWSLNSGRYRVQVRRAISGAGGLANNLPLSKLRSFEMCFPSLEEQQRIAAFIDDQAAKIDILIVETERFIELARERRSALITAAVTGQIDVREVA